ncbi:hypothetical protein Echvi_2244 [Echinicola vietnamensis DSM 17526]|uniref:Uncharacterized protein n=1 Tax=Echinicola vietnamensis (strain DSM 17526 / LMG 23754 / KMM 6221) TaxID=926556 RepID=L0FYY5_ECHVK|nr:hypothetical protein Echvi_2244 [Echinicola vietnamensis DSM 17526]
MKELSFERMESVRGGGNARCFFAIPLFLASHMPFMQSGSSLWYACENT